MALSLNKPKLDDLAGDIWKSAAWLWSSAHSRSTGATFPLAYEAKCIDLAFLFDPMTPVHTSNVNPLPDQIPTPAFLQVQA